MQKTNLIALLLLLAPPVIAAPEARDAVRPLERRYVQRKTLPALWTLAEGYERVGLIRHAVAAYQRYQGQAPPSERQQLARVRAEVFASQLRAQVQEEPRPWPYLDATVGALVAGRSFSFRQKSELVPGCYVWRSGGYQPLVPCPRFPTSVTGGLLLEATVTPLARHRWTPLRGLAVVGSLALPLWPDTRIGGQAVPTRELRLDLGLHWLFNPAGRWDRPALLLSLQYHLHRFSLEEPEGTTATSGLPALQYQALALGAGGRIPFTATDRLFAGAALLVSYRAVLAVGALESGCGEECASGGFGPTTAHGLGVQLTALELFYRRLSLRVEGRYDLYLMDFTNGQEGLAVPVVKPAASHYLAAGAVEHSFGVTLSVGGRL